MYMGMVWTRLCKVNFSGLPYTTILHQLCACIPYQARARYNVILIMKMKLKSVIATIFCVSMIFKIKILWKLRACSTTVYKISEINKIVNSTG